jgi:hypothetical protein
MFLVIAETGCDYSSAGILIEKVYGHLANEHRKAMAERVNFEPVVLQNAANA